MPLLHAQLMLVQADRITEYLAVHSYTGPQDLYLLCDKPMTVMSYVACRED